MTLTALDDVTVRIESEEPTHVMDSVLAEWVFTIWLEDGSDYVFTGPYKVDAFVSGDHVDLVPNTYYANSESRPNILLKKYASSDALATASENLELDVGFHLPADSDVLSDVRGVDGMNVRTFEVGYHYMAFHNVPDQRRAPFGEVLIELGSIPEDATHVLDFGRVPLAHVPVEL